MSHEQHHALDLIARLASRFGPTSRIAKELKWSGKTGQRAKVYPTRMNGYENDEATELFRQV
jgi:hypothetical protein